MKRFFGDRYENFQTKSSYGDKCHHEDLVLMRINRFISNGDTNKWCHIWFEMKWKIIIDFLYHFLEYLWHITAPACYRFLISVYYENPYIVRWQVQIYLKRMNVCI